MKGHFIVCGMGHVGYRIVDLLGRLGETMTVITQSTRAEWLHAAQARGVQVRIGDAQDERLLLDAGIHEAQAVLAVTDRDLVNIEIALDAKRLHPAIPVVVRLFEQNLARQLESAFDIRRALGMSALAAPVFAAAALGERIVSSFTLEGSWYVIGRLTLDAASPLSNLSTRHIVDQYRLALLTHAHEGMGDVLLPPPDTTLHPGDRVTLVGRKLEWDKVTGDATAPGPVPGTPLRRLAGIRQRVRRSSLNVVPHIWRHAPWSLRLLFMVLNVLIIFSVFVFHVAMNLTVMDALYFIITTVTTVGYGDITPRDAMPWLKLYGCLVMILGSATMTTLYSIITDFIITARFQQLLGGRSIPQADHIVVVGLGGVGYRTVQELQRAGTRVVGIDLSPDSEFIEAIRTVAPVIIGDARVPDILAKAGVLKAHAVVAATGNDAVNLSIGLATRRLNPQGRTVVRLFDADFARKVRAALHIDVAMSASLIAAPTFVAASLYPDVEGAFVLDTRLFILIHRPVGVAWHGCTPSQLQAEHAMSVLMRQSSAGQPYRPACDDAPLRREENVLTVTWRQLRD
jgi:Trk K+ transport system NAD-binding subunit